MKENINNVAIFIGDIASELWTGIIFRLTSHTNVHVTNLPIVFVKSSRREKRMVIIIRCVLFTHTFFIIGVQ